MEDLQYLVLPKQYKYILPDRVVTYINEQKVIKVSDAAQLVDEFVLAQVFFGENHGLGEGFVGAETGKVPVKADCGLWGKFDPNRLRNYCFGKGHWRSSVLCGEGKSKC